MKIKYLAAIAGAVLSLHSMNASAQEEEYSYATRELPGDIITGVVPIAAYWIAANKDDKEGKRQYFRNLLVNQIIIGGLRVGLNSTEYGERPNGNQYAFPSGHVGFVTSGASFLYERYGWEYGVPAYLLSGYVAFSRVETDHHKWRDVIAATVISHGIAKLFVTPENATHLAPVIGPEWFGFRVQRSF